MQPAEQNPQITPYQPHIDSCLIPVGDTNYVQVNQRVYCITELHPTALQTANPPPIAAYANGFWDSFKWLAVGVVSMGFFALLAYSLTRLFVPAPMPIAAPAPAAPPVVIIQQPPEKKPFSRRDCRSDGLFGWGESCTEEKGYE